MSHNFQSEYGDKLYGRLMERWNSMDHCQSSPVLVNLLLDEVKSWLLETVEENPFSGRASLAYECAIKDLLSKLR